MYSAYQYVVQSCSGVLLVDLQNWIVGTRSTILHGGHCFASLLFRERISWISSRESPSFTLSEAVQNY